MSRYQNTHDDDVPRFEPWLGVMISSFVPLLVALEASSIFLVPLIAMTVLLFAAGLLMLRRQTIRRARERSNMLPSTINPARSFDGERLEMEGAEP
jgi:hypothetical protein